MDTRPPPPALAPPVVRAALFGASAVVIVAGLRAAASILTPLALAMFIAAVSLPALSWLRRRRVPTGLAILVIVLIDVVILSSFGWIVAETVFELREALPEYIRRGNELETAVRAQLLEWGVPLAPGYWTEFMQPEGLFDALTGAARNATTFLAVFFLIVLYLVFILAESVNLPSKIRAVFGSGTRGGEDLRGVAGVGAVLSQVERYLVLKTMISLGTGLLIGVGARVLGVDFALFWGFLAFTLNFVPNIGSLVAAIPAVLVALLQLGPGPALAFAGVFMITNVLFGNFLEPILIGRHLRIAPIVTLVSLVFWGWTWGIIGMFLAVPLTITMRIVMENSIALRRFAPLLGSAPEPPRAGVAAKDPD